MSETINILGHFPESKYAPVPEYREAYWAQVAAGYRQMRKSRIVFTGLARDVAWILPWTMVRLSYTGERFRDFRIVIYENDSSDATRELLQDWSDRDSRVHLLTEQRSDPVNPMARCPSRAQRMSYYRGQCQAHIRKHFADMDHVMIVDTDLVGGWSYDGVANCLARQDWDFVGANGIIYRRMGWKPNEVAQYDAWAYRKDPQFTPWTTKDVNQLTFRRGEPWHAVSSCFGGVGIYRTAAYLAGDYTGDDLEHINLHQSMRRQGYDRVYLNPSLIAVYGRKARKLDQVVRRIHSLGEMMGLELAWEFDPRSVSDSGDEFEVPRAA